MLPPTSREFMEEGLPKIPSPRELYPEPEEIIPDREEVVEGGKEFVLETVPQPKDSASGLNRLPLSLFRITSHEDFRIDL